ncbi:hypothetical protein V8F20_000258 [Naviculisporaceae sp. PSN 640]
MAQPGSRRSSQTGSHSTQSTTRTAAPPAVPAPREPKPSEKIPILTSTLPAIFLPLDHDITKEDNPLPRDRLERIKRILDTIDNQRVSVKENIVWLLEREKERMVLEARERDEELVAQGHKTGLALSALEVDQVIHSLEAPAVKGRDYNITDAPPLNEHRPLPTNPRVQVIDYLLNWVEGGSRELDGYENHIAAIRTHYEEILQRETARIEAVGMRPEDRPKAPSAMM